MNVVSPHIVLTSTDMTAAFATKVGAILSKGDTLLLQGDIGAGKSFSPTFTLVQTYETRTGEIWHADLYRLSDPSEADELGLYDAFTKAICLIEWPDRLGNSTPKTAVTLTFETTQNDDERCVTIKENTSELAIKLLKALS
jgi:tRNA threonylcarbamoyladenosine biosynthesis protein TsaE